MFKFLELHVATSDILGKDEKPAGDAKTAKMLPNGYFKGWLILGRDAETSFAPKPIIYRKEFNKSITVFFKCYDILFWETVIP